VNVVGLYRQIAPHQRADTARIDHRHLGEIEDDLVFSVGQYFGHVGVEAIQWSAHAQPALQLDDFDAILSFDLKFQGPPSFETRFDGSTPLTHLPSLC
jgi:hypothetical protein